MRPSQHYAEAHDLAIAHAICDEHQGAIMPNGIYRIESERPIVSALLHMSMGRSCVLDDGELAVVVAAKSQTIPPGQEIRVVHVPTGEILFRKPATVRDMLSESLG